MHQFTHSLTVYKGSLFSTFSSAFAMCGFLFSTDSHSDKCEGRAQWALIGISLMTIGDKYLLMPWLHFPLGKMSIQVCPFFSQVVFLMLSCLTCSYILDNNPLLALSVANIFSHSVLLFFYSFFLFYF